MKKNLILILFFCVNIFTIKISSQTLQDGKLISDILARIDAKEPSSTPMAPYIPNAYNSKMNYTISKRQINTVELETTAFGGTPTKTSLDAKYFTDSYLSHYQMYLFFNNSAYPLDATQKYFALKALLNSLIPPPDAQKKESWEINDPLVIRDKFITLASKGRITILDKPVTQSYLEFLRVLIEEKDSVIIYVTKSPKENSVDNVAFYYKNEFNDKDLPDSLKFPLFDEVSSTIAINDVIPKEDIVRDQSKWPPIYKQSIPEDFKGMKLRISMFDPELILSNKSWNADASLFAKWGNDNIPIYGWYSDEIAMGIKYKDNQERLSGAFGIVAGTSRPFKNLEPLTPFYNSGLGFYASLSGQFIPLTYLLSLTGLPNVEENLIMTIDIKSDLKNKRKPTSYKDINQDLDFYTIRNYINYELRYKIKGITVELFRGLNIGAPEIALGGNQIDVRMFRLETDKKEVFDLGDDAVINFNKNMISLKLAFVKSSGFITHRIELFFNSNKLPFVKPDYSFLGSSIELMFNNWIGFQAKVAARYGGSELPWTKDIYGVFSPIIILDF